MDQQISLSPIEMVAGRPFSDPNKNYNDLEILHYMLNKLRSIVGRSTEPPDQPDPIRINLQNEDGATHRIVIVDWKSLHNLDKMTAVGFFGQIRDNMDHTPLMEVENQLVDELGDYPGLICYYNLHLPEKGYGNLVLCTDPEVKEAWRSSPTHIHAAEELASKHYHSIRLHNGNLRGGLMGRHELQLTRTKYYAFDDKETWRAVREFV